MPSMGSFRRSHSQSGDEDETRLGSNVSHRELHAGPLRSCLTACSRLAAELLERETPLRGVTDRKPLAIRGFVTRSCCFVLTDDTGAAFASIVLNGLLDGSSPQ